MKIDSLLRLLVDQKGSDLFLSVGIEPCLKVNGKLVARGEAVVINEKFGVRLTDIISPIERVKQLG